MPGLPCTGPVPDAPCAACQQRFFHPSFAAPVALWRCPGLSAERPRCGTCLQKPAIWQHAHAWMDYSYPCNTLIARWKFAQQPALAAHFARWMRQDPQVINLLDKRPMYSSPSPCHRSACESADKPRRTTGTAPEPRAIPPHCLQRTRHTTAQSDLTRAQRLRNLRHAFAVADAQRHRITDRHVLLIDDVMTTGATFTAASHCLLQAGARQILMCFAWPGHHKHRQGQAQKRTIRRHVSYRSCRA